MLGFALIAITLIATQIALSAGIRSALARLPLRRPDHGRGAVLDRWRSLNRSGIRRDGRCRRGRVRRPVRHLPRSMSIFNEGFEQLAGAVDCGAPISCSAVRCGGRALLLLPEFGSVHRITPRVRSRAPCPTVSSIIAARDVEMRAGANAAVHHGEQDAALAQGLDHLVAADAGAIGLEEHQIGFGLLHLDALDLRQAARQRAGVGVIVRKAIDMVVEGIDAGRGANAGLAHRSAQALLPAPDFIDEIAAAPAITPPTGAPRPLEKSIQAESHPAVMSRAEIPVATQAFSSRAPSMWVARPLGLAIRRLIEGCLLPDRAAADIGGLFDADDGCGGW